MLVRTEAESRAAPAALPDFQRASSDGARSAFGLKISRGSEGMGAVRTTHLRQLTVLREPVHVPLPCLDDLILE